MMILDTVDSFIINLVEKTSKYSEYTEFGAFYIRELDNDEIQKVVVMTGNARFFVDPFEKDAISIEMRFNYKINNASKSDQEFIFIKRKDSKGNYKSNNEITDFYDLCKSIFKHYEGLRFTIEQYPSLLSDNESEYQVSSLSTERMLNIIKNNYIKGVNRIIFNISFENSTLFYRIDINITRIVGCFFILIDLTTSEYPEVRIKSDRITTFCNEIKSSEITEILDNIIDDSVNKWIKFTTNAYKINEADINYSFRLCKSIKGENDD